MASHQLTTLAALGFHLGLCLLVILGGGGRRLFAPPPPAAGNGASGTPPPLETNLVSGIPGALLDERQIDSPFYTIQFSPLAPELEPAPPTTREVAIAVKGLIGKQIAILEVDGRRSESFRAGDVLIGELKLLEILANAVVVGPSPEEARTIVYAKTGTFEIPK